MVGGFVLILYRILDILDQNAVYGKNFNEQVFYWSLNIIVVIVDGKIWLVLQFKPS